MSIQSLLCTESGPPPGIDPYTMDRLWSVTIASPYSSLAEFN